MPEIILTAGDGHVQKLAHESDPLRALVELIWNAIDAEANLITVTLKRDDQLGAIVGVVVEDDGHGISIDEVNASFGRIGDSWKARSERSKNDLRGLHGRSGEGRLRAFALGDRVEWDSTSADSAGNIHRLNIRGQRSQRHVFDWSATPAHGTTRTRFTAHNDGQRSLGAVEPEQAIPVLLSHFAPVLLNDAKLEIRYGTASLDPAAQIVNDESTVADVEGSDDQISVRVIEWATGKHHGLYYGSDDEHFVQEADGKSIERQFSYSAYVSWPGFANNYAQIQLGDMAPDGVRQATAAARRIIREHFASRRRERRREQVSKWKETGLYPYAGEPDSEQEVAERAVFDVVSGTLSSQIDKGGKESTKLTLALLRDVVRHDPERLTTILHEVASLNADDRETLTSLLGETSLPAIIRSANNVASRNKFLAALDHLIFDPDDSSKVGERDHLHKLLENELWIFGEQYNLMNSERGLTQVLRTHLKLSGLDDKGISPVKRWDGKSGRVDLHLAVVAREHDRLRHLIVELKAPDVEIGRTELNQVEDYGNAIVSDPQFADPTAEWDIVLVGKQIDPVARNRIKPGLGQFWQPEQPPANSPKVRAFVREWRPLIEENRRRLDFFTKALEHDPSLSDGLNYVRERYAQLLPDAITDPGSAAQQDVSSPATDEAEGAGSR